MSTTMPPPLFIPLRREFFLAFMHGTKVHELRLYGPRWNESTCWPGREVILSCGYGKTQRLHGEIACAAILPATDLPPRDRNQFVRVYGSLKHKAIVLAIGNLEPVRLH